MDAIPSEMEGSDVQVGPELDGDEQDRDRAPWIAGFDSPGCCVGLYSAQQSRAPEAHMAGMHRIHSAYFLVCKAGAGLAGQTFHSRLVAALVFIAVRAVDFTRVTLTRFVPDALSVLASGEAALR